MKTLLISCLLLALLHPVVSLLCETCWNVGIDCLNKNIEECDESRDQSCLSSLGVAKMSFWGSKAVVKSCINTKFCGTNDSSASITTSKYIYRKTSCCKADLCNSGVPEAPKTEKREPNGLRCPSCLSIFSDKCEAQKTVRCRNEEDQCFYIGGHVILEESTVMGSARGCATASFCNNNVALMEAESLGLEILGVNITHIECSKAMVDDDIEP